MTRIGIIGLGLVGNAIAERLLSAGYEVVGFDIASARNADLDALGGQARHSAGEVFSECDRVILSLPTSGIVRDVLQPLSGVLSGKLMIDTTTGDPGEVEQIGRDVAARGADYLVATIAGSSTQVRQGGAIVMTGGADHLAATCDDVLSVFATQRFHVGTWLAAARMKLVVNLVLGLHRAVLAEGLSFANRCGIEPGLALEILKAGPAFSRVMEIKGRRMVDGDFAPEARLSQHMKDVQLILNQGADLGATLPLSTRHLELLLGLVERFGDQDNSAIIRAFDRSQEPV